VADLGSYLDLTVGQARQEFRDLLRRRPVSGSRQANFLPAETLLCLAASFLVNHRQFGGATAHRAPEPVPTLATLFSRPPSSVLAKMANLDGSRSHGARWDVLAGAVLREDLERFTHIYRILLQAARTEGIGQNRLPDFLGIEAGDELTLLGQDELEVSVLEADLRDKIARHAAGDNLSELQTGSRRCANRCSCPQVPSRLPRSISTGTGRRSLKRDRNRPSDRRRAAHGYKTMIEKSAGLP